MAVHLAFAADLAGLTKEQALLDGVLNCFVRRYLVRMPLLIFLPVDCAHVWISRFPCIVPSALLLTVPAGIIDGVSDLTFFASIDAAFAHLFGDDDFLATLAAPTMLAEDSCGEPASCPYLSCAPSYPLLASRSRNMASAC